MLLIADEYVIIEIKAAETLTEAHECQLINWLKAPNIEVDILLTLVKE